MQATPSKVEAVLKATGTRVKIIPRIDKVATSACIPVCEHVFVLSHMYQYLRKLLVLLNIIIRIGKRTVYKMLVKL